MLVELRVSNYALIKDLKINFSKGLNVLSGETGAGKSIVIGAINLLLGERAAVEQIRQGQETAFVEGIVSYNQAVREEIDQLLDEAGIAANEELIIAREVFRNGRSIARVNGRTVPVSFLKEIGQLLVDLHGQHQHQSLLRPEQHMELLDSFGGETISKSRERLAKLYYQRQQLKKELSAIGESSADRERRLDVYAFQVKEIRDAALKPGEDEELLKREKVLANAEKIGTVTGKVYSDIYSGSENSPVEAVIDRLNKSQASLTEAAAIDAVLQPLLTLLENALANLGELSHELRDYQARFEYDPTELEFIQERIDQINSLKRKYGGSIEAIIEFAEQAEIDIERLRNSEEIAERLEKEISDLEAQLIEESKYIRSERFKTAKTLQIMLEDCLTELALPNSRFEVIFKEREEFTPKGMDQVEFLFSANPGEDVKPLARIISGGEVSRVMLALKTILARQDLVPTLIFDEVDSGIGGVTIQAVAEKLAHLSVHHQVMCVTHSPQIAAMADCHFQLFKETVDDRTLTMAVRLSDDIRREELARMLDGASIDQVSLQHVDSLLERARRFKANQPAD